MSGEIRRAGVSSALSDHRDRILALERASSGDAVLSPASLMGSVLGSARLSNGFGVTCGTLYLPDRDGPSLAAGEVIGIDYSHYDPDEHFIWVAARAHLITGLKQDDYAYNNPWESDPFDGSIGGYHSGGSPVTWNRFHSFLAVSDDDTDSVTWTTPAAVGAEQYSWDLAGYGHIGYAFHDFTSSPTTVAAAATFSGSPVEAEGAIVHNQTSGTIVIGAVVGETTTANTVRLGITLTDDIPEGSGLIIVVANRITAGFYMGDVQNRPRLEVRMPAGNLIPKYRIGDQLYPLFERAGGSVKQT